MGSHIVYIDGALISSECTIYVNDIGPHNVHILHLLRLSSTLAWWWLLYSRNMSPY